VSNSVVEEVVINFCSNFNRYVLSLQLFPTRGLYLQKWSKVVTRKQSFQNSKFNRRAHGMFYGSLWNKDIVAFT
jgi:hypothetical protein